jgi:hypothetical protein
MPDGASTPRRPPWLVAFVFGVVVALLAGYGIGRALARSPGGTVAGPDHTHGPGEQTGADDGHDHGAGAGAAGGTGATAVGGLVIGDGTFRLEVERTEFPVGRPALLRFQVVDAGRRPVTRFTVQHDKPLHLIVARRDLSGYQHLHPTMAPDGTWSVRLTLPAAGVWRAYADFAGTAANDRAVATTLGVDLTANGVYAWRPLPPPAAQATVGDYRVAYAGRPRVGATQPLLFTIERAGEPVTPEPYLAAYGHLVVLREGDLGYVHVHPEPRLADGAVKFWLAAPSPGRYRMFFDFQAAGTVYTAEFTLAVG